MLNISHNNVNHLLFKIQIVCILILLICIKSLKGTGNHYLTIVEKLKRNEILMKDEELDWLNIRL